jgi:hypothetical protein
MFKRGRLIRDSFASLGMVLAIAGIGLLPIQYLVWRKTDVWPAMQIRTVFDLMSIATPQGVDAVLELPLSIAMLTVGLVLIWIAVEIYERPGEITRVKT